LGAPKDDPEEEEEGGGTNKEAVAYHSTCIYNGSATHGHHAPTAAKLSIMPAREHKPSTAAAAKAPTVATTEVLQLTTLQQQLSLMQQLMQVMRDELSTIVSNQLAAAEPLLSPTVVTGPTLAMETDSATKVKHAGTNVLPVTIGKGQPPSPPLLPTGTNTIIASYVFLLGSTFRRSIGRTWR
jgi:hypothetical protein